MGFAEFLAAQNLNPAITARLTEIAGPTPGENADYLPPSAEEMQRYGAKPAEVAIAQNANAPRPDGASPASPTAQPSWTPEAQGQREQAAKEAAETDSPQDLGEQPHPQEAPASPGRYVAPHWQPGTRSEAVRYGMNPDALAPAQSAYESATGHGIAAGEKRLEAAQQAGMADAVYASAHAQAAQRAAEQMRRMENEKQAYIIREGEKLEDLTLAAQQKIDPDAAKGSLGAQIIGAIGIAMGQFGASLNGGQNTALQIVNSNIDRRIKAQEMNIANAGKSLSAEQSLYKQNLDAFGDRERAVLATKIQYLEQVRAMSDMQYAAAKSSANEADKHDWDAKLMKDTAEYKTQFAKLTQDVHETNANEKFVPGQVVGGSPGPKKDLANLVTLSDGTTVQMPNEKQQDKAIEKIQMISQLQRMNNDALATRKKLEKVDPLLDRTEYNTLHKHLEDLEESKAAAISTEAGQGVLKDSEYARSVARQGFYTDGIGFFKGNWIAKSARESADANIRMQIKKGDVDQRAFVRAAGGHVVQRGYATGPDGQKAPVAQYTGQDVKPAEQMAPSGFKPLKKSAGDIPTAEAPLGETTPQAHDFGRQPVAPAGAGKAGKDAKTHHVKGRK